MSKSIKVLTIIQARLTSTRLPGKVLMKVGGKSMIARVSEAARASQVSDKIVVAWAHKFPWLEEGDVLSRFRAIVKRYEPTRAVIRLTSDCPLLHPDDVIHAYTIFQDTGIEYYSNHYDGHDVQVFKPEILWTPGMYHKEHVIADFSTPATGLSVNTQVDLDHVRTLWQTKHS